MRIGLVDPDAETGAGWTGALRRLEARHPEWWVLLAAAAAWIWIAAAPHGDGAHAAHGTHHGAAAPAGVAGLGMMVVAMMLPLTVGPVRQVAASERWTRRHRSIAGFLAGYLAAWMLMMIVITGAWSAAASLAGWAPAALAVTVLATLWEIAPASWRRMRGSRTAARTAGGWRGDAERARAGAATGVRCGASCWALMAACVALGHGLPVMAALFGVQLSARYPRRPVRALAAMVVLGACLAAIAARGTTGHPG